MNAISAAVEEAGSAPPRLARTTAWLLRRERALFAACVLVLLAPVWAFTHFPSTDGPVHLNIAQIFRDYDDPAADLYRRYFDLNDHIEPNVTAHYALAELGRIMDLLTAEKILLTVILVALAYGARCAVRAVSPASTAFSFLFLPTAYSYFFNEGYYNFCLGLGLYLLVFGYWYARREAIGWRQAIILAALGLAVVWTHLIALAMLTASIGVVTTVEYALRWLRADRDGERRRTVLRYAGRAGLLLLIFAPALIFPLSFFERYGFSEPPVAEQDYMRRFKHLVTMSYLFTHSPWEIAILSPFLALLVFLAVRGLLDLARRRPVLEGEAFLAMGGLLAVVYMTLPVTTKGVEITQRFLPFILFMLMLWMAVRPPSARLAAAAVAVVLAVVAGSTAYRFHKFGQYEGLIQEYESAGAHVEPGSVLLALHFWRQEMPLFGQRITWRSDPLRHISSHIMRETGGVDLRSYMIHIGYFPVRYRKDVDPYLTLGPNLEKVPPQLDLTPEGGGPRVDYVLTLAYPNDDLPPDAVRQAMDQIERSYELIYVSPEQGLVRLYRRIGAE